MDVSFLDVGEHCWTMKDNCPTECVVVAIRLDMFFGSERKNGFGQIQLFDNDLTVKGGITYTLKCAKQDGDYFKRLSLNVFMSKQELINSL